MKKIMIIVVILIVCIVSIYLFMRPIPIVENIEEAEIQAIIVHVYENGSVEEASRVINYDIFKIEDYDENAVLEYLSTCETRRSLFAFKKYIDNLEVEIYLSTSNGRRHIILGSLNVSYGGNWIKYKILNSEEVIKEIKNLINYDSNTL